MVNYSRVQFVSIELGISPITLIHNRLHAWQCFLVAPRRRELRKRFSFFVFSQCNVEQDDVRRLVGLAYDVMCVSTHHHPQHQ